MSDATIQLVLPMAGEGRRFADIGITTPKPLINLGGILMFELVLSNLVSDRVQRIVLIARQEFHLSKHIERLREVFRVDIHLVEVAETTGGPADSVMRAAGYLDSDQPVVVANSDQFIEMDTDRFYAKVQREHSAGCILTMEDNDPKWSFAEINDDGEVVFVAEKRVISPFATVGIYGFGRADDMLEAFREMELSGDRFNGELYVAPAYNYLQRNRGPVTHLNLGPVGEVMHGLGTPEDLDLFLNNPKTQDHLRQAMRRLYA